MLLLQIRVHNAVKGTGCTCIHDTHTYIWYVYGILQTSYTVSYVAILGSTAKWPQKQSQSMQFIINFWGSMPPDPPSLTRSCMQTHTFDIHVTPLQEILATGLLHLSLGGMRKMCEQHQYL